MARRPEVPEAAQRVEISLRVNGEQRRLTVDTRSSVLDVLREQLDLTGSKKGCDHGQCGACTVLLDGRRINSCLALAVAHDGAEIITVEGLATDGELHPLQAAFVAHDGFQCGYCTPGQLCSGIGAIDEARRGWPSAATASPPSGSDAASAEHPIALGGAEIRERMSGNLCRCGAYPGIVAAIEETAR
jgi:xanthine dehydrogenase YagT iron-sulfur-binding subunit